MEFKPFEFLSNQKDGLEFEKNLYEKPNVIIILGKRRSGKTALAYRIIENALAKGKKLAYHLRFPTEIEGIINVGDLTVIEPESCVVVDEADLIFPARLSRKKLHLVLTNMLKLASQKDFSPFVLTVHNTALLEVNALRLCDVLIIKEPSLLQIDTERGILKSHLQTARDLIEMYPKEERMKYAYIYSDDFRGLIRFEVPSFWSQKISCAFRDYQGWKE